jgi:OOP family OmpA-OmpF porin
VDYLDDCPDSDKNVTVNKRGCAPDNDNDGVREGRDLCEGTPAGVEVDATGCEVIREVANIVDPPEQAPNIPLANESALTAGEVVEPGVMSMRYHVVSPDETLYSVSFGYGLDYKQVAEDNNIQAPYNIHIGQKILIKGIKPGDSVVSSATEPPLDNEDGDLILSLSGDSFALGSTILRPDARSALDAVIAILKEGPHTNVHLNGYTDHLGDAEYNQRLSEGRAISVKDYLVSQGIASERLQARGYGEIAPVSLTDSVEALAKNRRVDIIVIERD